MRFKLFKSLLIALAFFAIIAPSSVQAQSAIQKIREYADNVGDEFTNIDQIEDRNLSNIPTYIVTVATGLVTTDGTVLRTGMIPDLSNMMAYMLTQPPAQTSYYIADVLQNTGIAQPAYAQGIGFSSLTPVLQIWKAFRNIAYFFFILIFVVIGFMIMFRKQIDHQAVVTVQMALPQIILTLILITFSYAIAGFVVDLIYLTIFIVTSIFEQFGIITNAQNAQGALFRESIWRIGWHYFVSPIGEAAGSTANAVSAVIQGTFGLPGGLEFLTDIVAYAIIVIAIIIAMFRTILSLLSAYIGIIISVIFAPIQLLFNAVPGSNTFSSWLRSLVANAAVFPAVAIMVMIGAVLSTGSANDPAASGITAPTDLGLSSANQTNGFGYGEGSGFVPPLLVSEPNARAFGVEQVGAIIGLGILMLLPEIAKIIKEALQVKGALGETALANLSAGSKPITAPMGIMASGIFAGVGQVAGGRALNWYMGRRAAAQAAREARRQQPGQEPIPGQEHFEGPATPRTPRTHG